MDKVRIFKNKVGEISPKVLAETIQSTDEALRLFAQDKDVGPQYLGSKNFLIATPSDIVQHILEQPAQDWCFYEHWQSYPTCLVLDIDLPLPRDESVIKNVDVPNHYIEQTRKYLLDKHNFVIPASDFLIQSSNRADKLSYHIKCKNIRFQNIVQQKYFWKSLEASPKHKFSLPIDYNIYQTHMALRMVHNHKRHGNHPSLPTSGEPFNLETFCKYSVIWFDDNEYIYDIPLVEGINAIQESIEKKNPKIREANMEALKHLVENYTPQYLDSPISEVIKQYKIDRALTYETWRDTGMAFKAISTPEMDYYITFIEFSKQSKKFSPHDCKRFWKSFKKPSETDQFLYNKGSLIRWAIQDNPLYKYKEPLRDLFQEAKTNNFWGIHVEEINQPFLTDLEVGSHKTIFIKSGQGSGKTDLVFKWLNSIKQELGENYKGSLTCITRRNLATTICSKSEHGYYGYKKGQPLLQIVNYADIKKNKYASTPDIAITPNSLIHLLVNKNIQQKSVMYIDEITPFLSYLPCSNLADRRQSCLSILTWYIQNVDYLIISDADISDDALKIIMSIRNKPAKMIWNKYPTDQNNKYHLISNYDHSLFTCATILKNGDNIFFACDTMKFTKKLAAIFREYNPVVYNADSDKEVRQLLKNINTTWSKKRMIICNSSCEYGVDFNDAQLAKQHFHSIFAVFKTSTISAQGANQILHRVRKTSSNIIYIHLNEIRSRYYPTDLESIRKMIKFGEVSVTKILYDAEPGVIKDVTSNFYQEKLIFDSLGNLVKQNQDELFDEILVRTLRVKFESLNDFRGWLRYYILNAGGTIVIDDYENKKDDYGKIEEAFLKDVDEKCTMADDADIMEILNAQEIQSYDVENFKDIGNLTKDQIYSLKKYYIKKTTGFVHLDEPIVRYFVQENKFLLEQVNNALLLFKKSLKHNVKHELKNDFVSAIGMSSICRVIVTIKELLALMGWNPEINLSEKMDIIAGINGTKVTPEIVNYFKNKDNIRNLRQMFGELGRMKIIDANVNIKSIYMEFVMKLLNHTCGVIMVKEIKKSKQGSNVISHHYYSYNLGNKISKKNKNTVVEDQPFNSLPSIMEYWTARLIYDQNLNYDLEEIPTHLQQYLSLVDGKPKFTQYNQISSSLQQALLAKIKENKDDDEMQTQFNQINVEKPLFHN